MLGDELVRAGFGGKNSAANHQRHGRKIAPTHACPVRGLLPGPPTGRHQRDSVLGITGTGGAGEILRLDALTNSAPAPRIRRIGLRVAHFISIDPSHGTKGGRGGRPLAGQDRNSK